jgi:hypothetical protein
VKKIQALGTETPIKLHTVCRISYSGIVGCPAADRRKWASIKKSNNSKFLRKAQEKDFWNSNLLKDKIKNASSDAFFILSFNFSQKISHHFRVDRGRSAPFGGVRHIFEEIQLLRRGR